MTFTEPGDPMVDPSSVRTRLGSVTVTEPGIGLRGIGAASRLYAKLVAESKLVTALSPPNPRRRRGYEFAMQVDRIVVESPDVRSLLLRRMDGQTLQQWQPGAHLDVTTPSGAVRQYSLAGFPEGGNHYRISVRKIDGGSASSEIHRLRTGDVLRVRGPRNAFPMARSDRYLFVAAGIGITPIRAMIERAVANKSSWTLYYHGRTRESLPFVADLQRMALQSNGRLIVRTDDVDGLPDVEEILQYREESTPVYVCGPSPLSRAIGDRLREKSPNAEFHTELFSPPPVVDGKPFRIRVFGTGETVDVGAEETALDALRKIRPDQPYSCRQGFCGACVVRYGAGQVDHRDRALDPAERSTSMALCVSRGPADGEVVLHLEEGAQQP